MLSCSRRFVSSRVTNGLIPTCASVPNRAVLSISGQNAAQFLNGILSTPVSHSGAFFSAFLHAQGRVLYDVFIYPQPRTDGSPDETFLIEYDPRPSEAPPLPSFLKRYILRSKVKVRDLADEFEVWASWNGEPDEVNKNRKWKWSRSGAIEPVWHSQEWPWAGTDGRSLRDVRAEGMGRRVLVRKGDEPAETATHDVGTSNAYTLHRFAHGVAEGTAEIVPMHAFPMESNLDVMGGLDFRKGCYVGQELTVRTYHTGAVRKRILPVQLFSQGTTPPPTPSANPSIPDLPPSDIQLTQIQKNPEARTPRPRGTNRLLSSVNGLGLALMRMEHVEAAERGELDMHVALNGTTYGLRHYLPDSWPRRGIDEID